MKNPGINNFFALFLMVIGLLFFSNPNLYAEKFTFIPDSIQPADSHLSTDTLPQVEDVDSVKISIEQEIIISGDSLVIEKPDTIAFGEIEKEIVADSIPDVAPKPEIYKPAQISSPVYYFDSKKVYTVNYDSALILPPASKTIYSGNEFFDPHLLQTHNLRPIKKKKDMVNWPVFVLLFSFALIGIARYIQPYRTKFLFNAALNSRSFALLMKEQNIFTKWFSNILLFVFIASFSLMVFLSIKMFGLFDISSLQHGLRIYFLIFLMVVVFYIVKYSGLKFIAYIFKSHNSTSGYFQNILLFNQILGIIILPILLYVALYQNVYVLVFLWVAYVLINIVKVFRSIMVGHNVSNFSLYYLFLYLCAVEIIPLLLIIKTSTNVIQELQ